MMRFLLLMQFAIFPLLQASTDGHRTLMEYFEEKCRKNGHDSAWIELKTVIQRLSTNPMLDVYYDNCSICTDSPAAEYLDVGDFVEKLHQCLDPESRFLTPFIINIFNYSRHTDWRLRSMNSTCRTSTSDVINLAIYNCGSRLWQLEDLDFKLTENYFCGELPHVQTCMLDVANDNGCETDSFFTYFFPFFEAGLMWCGNRYLELPGGSSDAKFSAATEFYFSLKCLRNGGANAMNDLMKFADEEFPNLQDLTEPVNPEAMAAMVCTNLSVVFYPYLEEVMNKVDLCLDNETKFLPNFALNTFSNTIEHLCKDGEESFVDQLEAIWNVSCQAPDGRLMPAFLFQTCAAEIISFNVNGVDYNYVLKESFFCQKLGIFIDCIVKKHLEHCSTIKMSKYVRMLLQPALEWCAGYGRM